MHCSAMHSTTVLEHNTRAFSCFECASLLTLMLRSERTRISFTGLVAQLTRSLAADAAASSASCPGPEAPSNSGILQGVSASESLSPSCTNHRDREPDTGAGTEKG